MDRELTEAQRQHAIRRAKSHIVVTHSNCHLWEGIKNQYGLPLIEVTHPKTGKRQVHSLRRIIYECANNVRLQRGDFVSPTCNDASCLNPDHLKLTRKCRLW